MALLDPDDSEAKRRRNRDRKGERNDVKDEKKQKKVSLCLNGQTTQVSKKKKKKFLKQGAAPGACTCIPEAKTTTCAGKCGSVINNCSQAVDCGPCKCEPACGVCQRCAGTTCEACDPCCDGFCCDRSGSICNLTTGSCCIPASDAETCANKCGAVTNNCGQTVDCGQCSNPTPVCAANVCVACSGQNPCPGGQVCCGGSCFAGVCCQEADCAPGGNSCVDRQCLCSGESACGGSTPDCCGTPGACTNTDTDTSNCGACGTTCSGATPNCVNGTCVADVCASGCPFNSVQAAINTLPAGSTIRIGAGTFGRIIIDKNITLIGTGANNTVLDGGASGRVVLVLTGVTATLQDLRITNGRLNSGDGIGSGIWNLGNLTLTGCTVNSNVNNDGGAGAGGIANYPAATMVMTDCTVSNNSAVASGGGIANSSNLTLTNCLVSSNHANQAGGGLQNLAGATANLSGTSVTGNTSGFSTAGIDNISTVNLTNGSEVSGNIPGNCGGSGTFTGTGCAP